MACAVIVNNHTQKIYINTIKQLNKLKFRTYNSGSTYKLNGQIKFFLEFPDNICGNWIGKSPEAVARQSTTNWDEWFEHV